VPGPQELLLIALVALFVLGPERLPEAARSAARTLARIRRYGVSATQELQGMADLGEIETEVQELRRELNRTRSELRRAVRGTVSPSRPRAAPLAPVEQVGDPGSSPAAEIAPHVPPRGVPVEASEGADGVDGADGAPDAQR
jgi:sec-independent protein translocase protein TatB